MAQQPFSLKRGPAMYNARRKAHAHPEDDFQRAVVTYLKFALPPEYRFRAGLEGVKLSAFQAAKAKQLGLSADWPDIEIMNITTGAVRWGECKSLTGRLTPGQRTFVEGCPRFCAVWRTLEDVEASLIAWGLTPRCSLAEANRYNAGVGAVTAP